MRERVDLKSPVRENRPPGSVRGAPGNRRPYRDMMIRAPVHYIAKRPFDTDSDTDPDTEEPAIPLG